MAQIVLGHGLANLNEHDLKRDMDRAYDRIQRVLAAIPRSIEQPGVEIPEGYRAGLEAAYKAVDAKQTTWEAPECEGLRVALHAISDLLHPPGAPSPVPRPVERVTLCDRCGHQAIRASNEIGDGCEVAGCAGHYDVYDAGAQSAVARSEGGDRG